MSSNATQLADAIGVERFTIALEQSRKVEAALVEMIELEPTTRELLQPIRAELTRQNRVAETRLENVKRSFDPLVSPHGDSDEFDNAMEQIKERFANLDRHFLKMSVTLNEATAAFASVAWRFRREGQRQVENN